MKEKAIIFPMKYLALLFLFLFSCAKAPLPPASQKPLLLVSIAPYRFLTEQIAGEEFEVQTIVPGATNPHAFEPKSSQVIEMAKAAIWFRIGEPFETKIIPVLTKHNSHLKIQDLRDGLSLIETAHSCTHCSIDHLDRHMWLSPKLAIQQAESIAKALSEKFPDHKSIFEDNLQKLSIQLTELDEEIQLILEPVIHRKMLVSHPAFAYFCKDYNFDQLSVEFEGKDPLAKHLEQILTESINAKLEIALALPQYNNKGAQLIAEKLQVPIHLIDPYSANYFETMRKLAHILAAPYEH